MSLNPSAQFTAKNELPYKTPMYLVEMQSIIGETFLISNVNPIYPIFVDCTDSDGNPVTWTDDEWVGYTAFIQTASGLADTRTIASNSANELTFHESLPMDMVEVGDTVRIDLYEKYCTYKPVHTAPSGNEPKPYVSFITGGGYSISPDEGSTSSATIKIDIQDKNGEVTEMIHRSTGRLQKKRCVVKAGYVGLTESQMLTVFTGEITNYSRNDAGVWEFSVSDVIRTLNKNIFRGAGPDDSSSGGSDLRQIVTGNPIDLFLALCISNNGDGKKGPYDNLPPGYGLDMPISKIDVEGFEKIRDDYFPITGVRFNFIMEEQITAIDFFVDEIFKPLNMYPIVKGDGKLSASVYRPVIPPFSSASIDENDIIKIPSYNGNLTDLINEVEFSYNHDGDDFLSIDVIADATSINARGVGDRTLKIESTGLKDAYMDADDFIIRSANRIFNRYATPPIELSVSLMLKWLTIESGDIIRVSNKFLPNLSTGNFDFEDVPMEVVKRTVDWKRGSVKLQLLQTGYEANEYAGVSPELIAITGISNTQFTIDYATAPHFYETGFVVSVWRRVLDISNPTGVSFYHFEKVADDIEITDITGTTVTTDDIGVSYAPDMRIVFNDNGTPLTDYQERWGRIDAGYLISP